jgi:cytochrome P450 family 6
VLVQIILQKAKSLHRIFLALSHDDITAQATIFFIAGFETSSTVLSFACLEMAVNNDIQRKAQLEVDEALSNHGGNLTYEALKEMQYLDCIIQGLTYRYKHGKFLKYAL